MTHPGTRARARNDEHCDDGRRTGAMSKQVLILNITRMGDLVQTGPLIARVQREWPGVAIDLVIDRRFASVGALLPGIRHVEAFDFEGLVEASRVMARDVTALFRQIAGWARPLLERGYDRVINLTFNRRSGLLAAYLAAPDIRGVTAAPDGTTVVANPWMQYVTDLHHYRRFNRFNLVDLYALGGSGPGPFVPLALRIVREAAEWAREFLGTAGARSSLVPTSTRDAPAPSPGPTDWVAVQVGASDAMKAWRPAYFGRVMAILSKRLPVGFVMIGSQAEAAAVRQAIAAYREAGGDGPLRDAAGKTTVEQLVALLAECRLLITNDTGPMHMAVAAGIPVIDISVGHVDFRETGPYGPGHWVVQPHIACAPCGFDQVCLHHACKDLLACDDVAALCLHALDAAPFPSGMTGVRVYASNMDDDGLACYELRAGHEDLVTRWYGEFWRRYWYEAMTGCPSRLPPVPGPAPDAREVRALFREVEPLAEGLVVQARALASLCRKHPLPVRAIQSAQNAVKRDLHRVWQLVGMSPAFGPPTVLAVRRAQSGDAQGLGEMACAQADAYAAWQAQLTDVVGRLTGEALSIEQDRRSAMQGRCAWPERAQPVA